jgi:TetR/AcrR family transcriptional regulator, transcriptional repressor for nem operon
MRTKAFDPATAVQSALSIFWEHGFEGTRMPELLEAMGIGKASFYNAFVSKHAVFLDVLDTYFASVDAGLATTLHGQMVRSAAIESLVDAILSVARKPGSFGGWRGCLIGNTSLELGASDDVVQEKLRLGIHILKRHFENALSLPDNKGRQLPSALKSAGALQCVAAVQGLLILAKSGLAEADVMAAKKSILASIAAIGSN